MTMAHTKHYLNIFCFTLSVIISATAPLIRIQQCTYHQLLRQLGGCQLLSHMRCIKRLALGGRNYWQIYSTNNFMVIFVAVITYFIYAKLKPKQIDMKSTDRNIFFDSQSILTYHYHSIRSGLLEQGVDWTIEFIGFRPYLSQGKGLQNLDFITHAYARTYCPSFFSFSYDNSLLITSFCSRFHPRGTSLAPPV